MVTEDTTFAIDAEFAFYGPIAFDVCKMIANLLIAYFASAGRDIEPVQAEEQRAWLLEVRLARLAALIFLERAQERSLLLSPDKLL